MVHDDLHILIFVALVCPAQESSHVVGVCATSSSLIFYLHFLLHAVVLSGAAANKQKTSYSFYCIIEFMWRSGWHPDHIYLADDWASARVGVVQSRLGPVRSYEQIPNQSKKHESEIGLYIGTVFRLKKFVFGLVFCS